MARITLRACQRLPCASVTRKPPSARASSPVTGVSVCTRTPRRFTSARSVSTISCAWSLCGNTLSPRSTFSAQPRAVKKSQTARLSNAARLEYINFGLRRICARISSRLLSVVTLQRPLPVMRILRPQRPIFSRSTTCAPAPAAANAAIMPLAPPPITMISFTRFTSVYPQIE